MATARGSSAPARPPAGSGTTAPWYASDPAILRDAAARSAVAQAARARGPSTAAATSARLEAIVEQDPSAAFAFDATGSATLRAEGRTFGAGRFATPTLGELRAGLRSKAIRDARARLSILHGRDVLTDIGTLQATAPEGVLFQVASQFNCLEAPGPHVVPVRQYVHDNTQGPRASVSALAGTLLRHHAAPTATGERFTQSSGRCLDLLGDVLHPGIAEVRSGYLSTASVRDLPAMAAALTAGFDAIRLGVHDEVEVVFGHDWDGAVLRPGARIAQVFTSTLALGGYGHDDGSPALIQARRQLLRAAYVGTLLAAAVLGKHTVVLTMIGGGVFGNPRAAIWEAIHHALDEVEPLLPAPLHVVVNTREELEPADAERARARGGFVARFDRGAVAVEG